MERRRATGDTGRYIRRYALDRLLSADLLALLSPRTAEPGELVIRAGDPVRRLLFFVDGKAKVYRTTESGQRLLTAFFTPFEVLGEAEIFSSSRFAMNVEAVTRSICLALPVTAVRKAASRNSRLFMYLCGRLGAKLSDRLVADSINLGYPVVNRLAGYLMAVTDTEGQVLGTDDLGELADYLGASYRQVSRVVQRFRREGILDSRRGRIRVVDRARLAPMARDLYVRTNSPDVGSFA